MSDEEKESSINKQKFNFTTRAYYIPEEITESEVKYARFTIYPKNEESIYILKQAIKLIERYEDSNYHYEEIFYFLEEISVEFTVSVENKMRIRYVNKIDHLRNFGITEEDIRELQEWWRFLEKLLPRNNNKIDNNYYSNFLQWGSMLDDFTEDPFWESNVSGYINIDRYLCGVEEYIEKTDLLAKAKYDIPTYVRQHQLKKNHYLAE